MNEKNWLTCADPNAMLEQLRGIASDRKLRLFACACCRSIWKKMADERSRRLVEIAEMVIEEEATQESLATAAKEAPFYDGHMPERETIHPEACDAAVYLAGENAYFAASETAWNARNACSIATLDGEPGPGDSLPDLAAASGEAEALKQAMLIREIFGIQSDPFTVDPTWLASDVLAIAQAIYRERRFADMPVLADALEEAGCINDAILSHCRNGLDHVRGCWALDLILGKE